MRRAREKTKPTVKRPPMCTDPFGTVVNKTELLMDRTLSLLRCAFNGHNARKIRTIIKKMHPPDDVLDVSKNDFLAALSFQNLEKIET